MNFPSQYKNLVDQWNNSTLSSCGMKVVSVMQISVQIRITCNPFSWARWSISRTVKISVSEGPSSWRRSISSRARSTCMRSYRMRETSQSIVKARRIDVRTTARATSGSQEKFTLILPRALPTREGLLPPRNTEMPAEYIW